MNKLITFLIRHTSINTNTIYALLDKIPEKEMRIYIHYHEEEKGKE